MIFLKKLITVFIILYLFTSNLVAFEQNGVKRGNTRVSAGLVSNQPKDKYNDMELHSEIGYFYNEKLEFVFGLQLQVQQEELYYTPSIGANYYFYNTPIFTPYVGGQIFYKNTSNEYIREKKGSKYYIGGHFFISENISITPEFGSIYKDFNIEKGTYFNTFLTYFF
jgi:hypothetical protein